MENKNSGQQLQSMLEEWFKKLPSLPASAVDGLYSIAPWIALVFGVIGVLGALSGFGALTFLAPFAVMGGASSYYGLGIISTVGWLVASVLMLLAFGGLKAGKISGWNMLFWSEVVSVVSSLVAFSLGTVVGAAIGFYLLFQIKSKYK